MKWRESIRRVNAAETNNFVELVKISGLNPQNDFRYANLSGVNFTNNDLSGFDFTESNLEGCNFKGAKISEANLKDAKIDDTALREALDWAIYEKRYLMQQTTMLKSQCESPHLLTPDEDIFLSYAREDEGTAAKLAELLKKRGLSVFWNTEIRDGADWRQKIESKLLSVKCVAVLWSKHSVASEFVLEEAEFGHSRKVLVAATLDDAKPPFGFSRFQTDALAEWNGETPPSGIVNLTARIEEFVADTRTPVDWGSRDNRLRLEQRRTQTEHISVSDHDLDRDGVLSQLADMPDEVQFAIQNGYSELNAAQHAARYQLNDRVPGTHYAAAAAHFQTALLALGPRKLRMARDGRTIEYFLAMAHADSLAFSEPGRDPRSDPQRQAIDIYTRLSHDRRYAKDAPLHFRLGSALSRMSRSETVIARAVRALRKARMLAIEADTEAGPSDQLLSESRWIHAEIAKQLGVCNYYLATSPGVTPRRQKKYLDDAIQETREAVSSEVPSEDPGSLVAFTVLTARGSLIFLLSQRIREGRGNDQDREEIRKLIALLKEPASWEVAQNQVHIIDAITVGAASIGDWGTAIEEAERNIENFAWLAIPNGLQPEEKALEVRAREIHYFAQLFFTGKAILRR